MRFILALIFIAITTTCVASIEKQKLIDQRIVLQHKIEDIDNSIKAIEADEITVDDKIKLKYYKEHLEKDYPVKEKERR